MAKLSEQEVVHIAKLARLSLGGEEIKLYSNQLTEILGLIEAMNSLDLVDLEPMDHTRAVTNVLREDIAVPILEREQGLAMAPEVEDGCFAVPRILDEG